MSSTRLIEASFDMTDDSDHNHGTMGEPGLSLDFTICDWLALAKGVGLHFQRELSEWCIG